MRDLTQKLLGLLFLPALFGYSFSFGQVTSRAPLGVSSLKTDGITSEVPCAGSVLLYEDFENGIPSGWVVIDGDTLTPRSVMQLQKGWQSRVDYRDTSNLVVVSPSWYEQQGASDDWLISPAVTLGNNPCLSWMAYSQDIYFEESYEVRVALTPDTAAFLANPIVDSELETSGTPHQSAASLSNWAGQTVYIAFRQTSDDKFVLALDDVKVTNVNAIDIGVYAVTYGAPDPGDTVTLRFQVANYGSDTVTNFQALYSLEGAPAKFMTIGSVSIPPNGTVSFDHDSVFVSDSLDLFYDFCAWTTLPNSVVDQEFQNDTLCDAIAVGSPVGNQEPIAPALDVLVYPNPFQGQFSILSSSISVPLKAEITVMDLQGRVMMQENAVLVPNLPYRIAAEGFAEGMYLVRISANGRSSSIHKLIKQ